MVEINKSVVIYKNCETLPVYNFMKIINTEDMNWLLKDYEEEQLEYQGAENLILVWNKIIAEYLDLKKDKKVSQSYDARIVIKRLEDKLNVCRKLISLCSIDIGLENIRKLSNALKEHDKLYEINLEKPLDLEVGRVNKFLDKLNFSIEIKKSNFEKEFSVNEKKDSKLDIYEEMANLEQSLKRNEINPKTTVVAKWIALCNLAKKQNG